MDVQEILEMINDKHFYNLKKMQYKYSADKVTEMIKNLKVIGYAPINLNDFKGQPCAYLPGKSMISTAIMKKLLASTPSNDFYGLQAMEEEINSTLLIENIQSSRGSIRKILQGFAPLNEEEYYIFGLKKGLEFISDPANKITEENLHHLYMETVGQFLKGKDQLPTGKFYRDDTVFIVGDKNYHQGLDFKLLPPYMQNLVEFANQKDNIPELIKACMLHFYLAYLHPYFDGNGRVARLLHLWYLVQQGFPSTLFYAFSKHINNSKKMYYDAFLVIEENYKISQQLDITPFLLYFKGNVYDKIETENNNTPIMQIYIEALNDGKITEKERDLWGFVFSAYGNNQFSTKQLEKDFSNAAYATIRGFVRKFEQLGLLSSQIFGNRVKYRIK